MPSHAHRQSRRIQVNLLTALFILSCVIFATGARAQTPPTATPSPDLSQYAAREDRELNEARRRNEEAQTAYYQKQTEKLNQSETPKTFWRALSDNAAILGALTAALVALFTLIVNQRNALRARKDTEFYEALKRFGDKDSPTVRASAVSILMEMSGATFFAWRWRKNDPWWRPDRKMSHVPYFDTALDQLVTGLLIEENSVVINAIVIALRRMMPRNFRRSADSLREANLKLQQDMTTHLTEFFVSKGAKKVDDVNEEVWKEAVILTRCPNQGLKAILKKFGQTFWNQSLLKKETDTITREDKEESRLAAIQNSLTDVGRRLLQNVKLCEVLIRERPESAIDSIDFRQMYLARVNFSRECNLQNIDFRDALMPRAFLMKAKLGGANLQRANLEGGSWHSADLTHAKLHSLRLDESSASLEYSNWWQADFSATWWETPGTLVVDEDLIKRLIARFGELSPEKLNEAHPSVKAYVAQRT